MFEQGGLTTAVSTRTEFSGGTPWRKDRFSRLSDGRHQQSSSRGGGPEGSPDVGQACNARPDDERVWTGTGRSAFGSCVGCRARNPVAGKHKKSTIRRTPKSSRSRKLLFPNSLRPRLSGRGERIRTSDLLNPIQARYQTAPHPVGSYNYSNADSG